MPVHEASAGLFGTGCPVHTNCVSVFALTGRLLFCTDPVGCANCRRRVRPFRAGRFSLNLSGRRERRGARRGGDAVPTAVGKKEGQPAVFLPLWTPTFPVDSLAQIADM